MIQIITQPNEAIGEFVSRMQNGAHLPWGQFTSIGLVRDGELIAGVIYNNWSAANVCMHVAAMPGRMWLVPEYLYAIFDYPFNEHNLRRVTGIVPKKNAAARRLDEHVGFKLEGSLRHALPHDDLLVYGMLRRECRFITDDYLAKVRSRLIRSTGGPNGHVREVLAAAAA